MEKPELFEILNKHITNFIQFGDMNPSNYAGWKYTIVGNSVEASAYLLSHLYDLLLTKHKVCFKVATKKQVECGITEQAKKLMTIYINKDTDVEALYADIEEALNDYSIRMWRGCQLQYSESVAGPIYKRVDLDENGYYIKAGN